MASHITGVSIVYSNVFFQRRSKKTSKLRVTGLCEGNSPVTGQFRKKRFHLMTSSCVVVVRGWTRQQQEIKRVADITTFLRTNAFQWLEGGVYLARCDSHSTIVDIWDTGVFTDGVTRIITMLIRERPCSCQNTLSGLILPVSALVRALQPPRLYQMRLVTS